GAITSAGPSVRRIGGARGNADSRIVQNCRSRRKEAHFLKGGQIRASLRRLLQFLESAEEITANNHWLLRRSSATTIVRSMRVASAERCGALRRSAFRVGKQQL